MTFLFAGKTTQVTKNSGKVTQVLKLFMGQVTHIKKNVCITWESHPDERTYGMLYLLGKPPRVSFFNAGKATQISRTMQALGKPPRSTTCLCWESHPEYCR